MRRIEVFAVLVTLFLVTRGMLLVLGRQSLSPAVQEVVRMAPMYALVSFGCYALWSIGLGLLRFRDCPEASEELKGEMAEAREYLASKGFKFD